MRIDTGELVELTQTLVRIPSPCDPAVNDEPAAHVYAEAALRFLGAGR